MSSQLLSCVVDANVALKLFFAQPGSEQADILFARLAADARARYYVPDFFYAECASAFVSYARQTEYTGEEARRDMADLLALALHVIPTASLATAALDISMACGISGYDAFYVALSQRVGAPLVTADERLVRALAGKPFRVFALTALEVPPLGQP